jgi:hypothetical protein
MLSETIENQNYITEILYNFVMRTSYVTKSKWINEKERHYELDGVQNKEHDTHSIANRISSLVSSALGKNATEIDAMTNEKIDDIKRLYDNDKKKQLEEIKLLKETNKKMLEDIQKLKTEKTTIPSPVNPTNNQMVVVDKKETTEKSVKIEKKNEVKKEEEDMNKITDAEMKKYLEIGDYFTKIENYILKDKKNDEKIRTFLKGELSEILDMFEEMDSDENSSFLKYDPTYKYFIKLTDKVTDEYIKTNFKEIKFILDPTNNGNITVTMSELFAEAFKRFCYPIISEIQKEDKEEGDKIEVD